MVDPALRFLDPARWDAYQNNAYLVKVYYRDMGCIESLECDYLSQVENYINAWINEKLDFTDVVTDYDFRLYGRDGEPITVKLRVSYEVEFGD